jgi:hypothetical protein
MIFDRKALQSIALCAALATALFDGRNSLGQTTHSNGQPENIEIRDGWRNERSGEILVMHRNLEISPAAEPSPAFSIQLLPNSYEVEDGNAALFYLQALGGMEQTYTEIAVVEFKRQYREKASKSGGEIYDFPPFSWLKTAPSDLPLPEVNAYLNLTTYQPQYLQKAWTRKTCDFERRLHEVESPADVILPEVQEMRDLARNQSLRFRVAIAENRLGDAIEIFGQQLAIANHLSQEPFLVSNLVGLACAGIGWADAFYLIELPDSPNIYWALAALPKPLLNIRYSLAYERDFLFEQFDVLKEVDNAQKPDGYWQNFVDRFVSQFGEYLLSDKLPSAEDDRKAYVVTAIALAYPGAKKYLLDVILLEKSTVDSLPTTHVVFLAMKRFHERQRDELAKLQFLPYESIENVSRQLDAKLAGVGETYGIFALFAVEFNAGFKQALSAQARLEQQLGLLQTIESIRHHMANNDNSLPQKLSALELPAPNEPTTGKPFAYEMKDGEAILSSTLNMGMKYEIRLIPR